MTDVRRSKVGYLLTESDGHSACTPLVLGQNSVSIMLKRKKLKNIIVYAFRSLLRAMLNVVLFLRIVFSHCLPHSNFSSFKVLDIYEQK